MKKKSKKSAQLQMIESMTAQEYKASLPKGRGGTAWTMESFSTYVTLRYPHITVASGQEWTGAEIKYKFVCELHGPYPASARKVLEETTGCRCTGCKTDKRTASAGKTRSPRATKEEKELAAKLRAEGRSYLEIARQLGRGDSTILRWLDPEQREKSRQSCAKWNSENREQHRANNRRYSKEFEHGRANKRKRDHKRRSLEYHAADVVFLPDHPDGDSQGFVAYDCYDLITTDEDRTLWSFPGADEDVAKRTTQQKGLEKISGEKYSLEHLIPLSRNGIHHPMNFVNRALKLNIQKGNKMLKEDMELFCKRLFE